MTTAALVNRVKQTSTTTGIGEYALDAPPAGFASFNDAAGGPGSKVFYVAENGTDWEIGIGTVGATGTTLARSTLLQTTTGSEIDWPAGTKTLFGTLPAQFMVARGEAEFLPPGLTYRSAQTTDATPTVMGRTVEGGYVDGYGYPTATLDHIEQGLFELLIVGATEDGAEAAGWRVTALVASKAVVGSPTVTQVAATAGAAAWAATLSTAAGTGLDIEVTGAAATTINWRATVVAAAAPFIDFPL